MGICTGHAGNREFCPSIIIITIHQYMIVETLISQVYSSTFLHLFLVEVCAPQ